MATNEERFKQFQSVMKGIEKSIESTFKSKPQVGLLSEARSANVSFISSGSLSLDASLGGGWARGRICEISGLESSGKTTHAIRSIADVQSRGGNVLFVDAEQAFDPSWAKKLGVDVDRLGFFQPESAEEALDAVKQAANSGVIDLIVVDSVAALTPLDELDNSVSKDTIGLQARIMSKSLRPLVGIAARTGTTILFINQLREKIGGYGGYGPSYDTPGGKALKFFASQRVRIKRGEPKKNGSEVVGVTIKHVCEKNKVAPPYKSGEAVLFYETGFDPVVELVEKGSELGIIEKKSTMTWVETVTGNEIQLTTKGAPSAIEKLRNDPELFNTLMEGYRARIAKGVVTSQPYEPLMDGQDGDDEE